MAVQQITSSFQNDGNYSQLDLQDISGSGPVMRIETFRCSQPIGDFGTTKAGTSVTSLTGDDHLSPESNKVFRHIYSTGVIPEMKVILEMRETFEEDGSFDVRIRDVDADSPSMCSVLIAKARPQPNNQYGISYEVRTPDVDIQRSELRSPLKEPITAILQDLSDISAPYEDLGEVNTSLPGNPLDATISWNGKKSEINKIFIKFEQVFQTEALSKWAANICSFERMGDFRDKCIHDGTNLTGPNPQLASEFNLIRAYRASLIAAGRVADPQMYRHTKGMMNPLTASTPIATDMKPGVYSVFLSAYFNNIEIYQLGIDKAHSDYGGVPMKLTPGSRLENAATPIIDSTRFNRTLAELAFAYYIGPSLPVLPALKAMDA